MPALALINVKTKVKLRGFPAVRRYTESVISFASFWDGRNNKAINPVRPVIAAAMFSTGRIPSTSPNTPEMPRTPNKLVKPI